MTKASNYLLALALLCAAATTHAACPAQQFAPVRCPAQPSSRACVEWQASTKWSDGTNYAAGTVVTYTVWLVNPNTTPVPLATTTATMVTIPGLQPGDRYFAVSVTVAGKTSVMSNTACKTIRFAGPTDGTIAPAPSDGSISPP